MQTAVDSPHPYLLNRAGGIVQIRSFRLTRSGLELEPICDSPATGLFQLVYRCPTHSTADIKRNVSCDGERWTIVDALPGDDDCDVCYPEPCA